MIFTVVEELQLAVSEIKVLSKCWYVTSLKLTILHFYAI